MLSVLYHRQDFYQTRLSVTQWVSYKKNDLLTPRENLCSPIVFSGLRVDHLLRCLLFLYLGGCLFFSFFFFSFFFFFVCLFVCLFVYLILFVFVLHFVSNVSRVAQLFILDFPFQFSLSIDKRAILRLCRINSTCVVRLLMMFLKTTHSLNLF
jgi:hypothetical protein